MTSYFDMLNRHGLKIWGSFMVGTLAAAIPVIVITFFFTFMLAAIVLARLSGIDPFNSSPEAILETLLNPGMVVVGILFLLFFILISLLTSAFTSAGSIGVVADSIQKNKTGVGTYFRYGFRRLFPMLGLHLVTLLLAVLPLIPVVIGVLLFFTETVWGVAWGIILFLLTIVLYIVYGLVVLHAPAVLIAKNKGVFEALSASFHAFRTKFGQVALSALILFAITMAGGIVTLVLEGLISGINPLDPYAEVHPLRSFLSLILMFPVNSALQVIVISTLVFRYLRVIHPDPPSDGTPGSLRSGPEAPSPVESSKLDREASP
ncbi:hypothetical protein [Novibacillus thermophilus]|uniref:Glycerophosphoryl diester phosphodiesterase membrane domain-containing protein n=1 Tax=Novibacillus thermophilus TaxID=1471761 RepID=A0A1U9K4Y5_9BACL|nr:hypothetical protein [Novibacillus thermophilus]AQS55094.1 hypothetical protein B0W44_04205 [Novibacillus thermophilus]